MNFKIENFIGTFDNVFSNEYCQSIIDHFEKLNNFHRVKKRADVTGQPAIEQQTDVYHPLLENDSSFISSNEIMLQEFNIKLQ